MIIIGGRWPSFDQMSMVEIKVLESDANCKVINMNKNSALKLQRGLMIQDVKQLRLNWEMRHRHCIKMELHNISLQVKRLYHL